MLVDYHSGTNNTIT